MTGAVKRRTTNFGFNIINYDFPRWHTYDWQNWDVIDAVLAAANLTSVRGVWENATDYVPGDRIVDDTDATLWVCNIAHTSASSGTFLADRTANPTYWTSVSSVPVYRGNWTTATNYITQDIIKTNNAYYLCIATHTSDIFANDLAAGRWTLIMDASDAINAAIAAAASASAAATSEGNAATSASAAAGSASSASTSATNAGNSATAAAGSATTAGTQATNAANSASAANTSAGNAATSATNAGNSATAASTSASNAATSATNAANSAAAAATSAANSVLFVSQSITNVQKAQARTNIFSSAAVDFVQGLITKNNTTDANNDIDMAVGAVQKGTLYAANSSQMTKRLDASWAAGNNSGGLDTGSKAANSTYHIWTLRNNTTGAFDWMYSLSATAPTVPSGYTLMLRATCVMTDNSSNIYPYIQDGNEITLRIAAGLNAYSGTTNRATALLTCPLPGGVRVLGLFTGMLRVGASADPSTTGQMLLADGNDINAATEVIQDGIVAGAGTSVNTIFSMDRKCRTDLSSRIYLGIRYANGFTSTLVVRGWVDETIPRI